MKPVKITAEITLTPEEFEKWCDGVIPPTEKMYQHYVKKMLCLKFRCGYYGKFECQEIIGDYEDFINKTIDDNGNGLKLTIEELK